MHGLRPVDGYADQEVVLAQELAPLIRQQRTVGLQTVVNMATTGIAPLQFQSPTIEADRPQQRFTAMPGEEHLGQGLGLNVLPHEVFQQRVAHRRAGRLLAEFLLLQVVAVVAGQIALTAYGLQHDIERTGKGTGCIHGRSGYSAERLV